MTDHPLTYYVAQARNREIERIARRPESLMGEELRHTGRTCRRRRGWRRA
jgi:hypothetical protein